MNQQKNKKCAQGVGKWKMGRYGEVGTSLPVHVSTIKDNLGTVCLCVLDTNWYWELFAIEQVN